MAPHLAVHGGSDQFLPSLQRAEQIAVRLQTGDLDQTIRRVPVRLQSPAGENVGHANAAFVEFLGNQERPVTMERLLFSAHQGDAEAGGAIHDGVEPAPERFSRGGPVKADAPFAVVTVAVAGPAPQAD